MILGLPDRSGDARLRITSVLPNCLDVERICNGAGRLNGCPDLADELRITVRHRRAAGCCRSDTGWRCHLHRGVASCATRLHACLGRNCIQVRGSSHCRRPEQQLFWGRSWVKHKRRRRRVCKPVRLRLHLGILAPAPSATQDRSRSHTDRPVCWQVRRWGWGCSPRDHFPKEQLALAAPPCRVAVACATTAGAMTEACTGATLVSARSTEIARPANTSAGAAVAMPGAPSGAGCRQGAEAGECKITFPCQLQAKAAVLASPALPAQARAGATHTMP